MAWNSLVAGITQHLENETTRWDVAELSMLEIEIGGDSLRETMHTEHDEQGVHSHFAILTWMETPSGTPSREHSDPSRERLAA